MHADAANVPDSGRYRIRIIMYADAANVTDTGMILPEFVVRGGHLFSLYFVQMLNPHVLELFNFSTPPFHALLSTLSGPI